MAQPDWMRAHDQRALRFEDQAADDTAAALRLALAAAGRQLAAEYVKAAGAIGTPVPPGAQDGLRAAVRRILTALLTGFVSELPRILAKLADIAARGLTLGAAASPGRQRRLRLKPSKALERMVRDLRKKVREAAAATEQVAATARLARMRDVTMMLAKATQVVNTVEQTARTVANQSVSEGARAAADAAGAPVLWIAERTACPTCLAYAGELAKPGELFPAGRTFGDSSTVKVPIEGPPAHPSCRCRIQPWYGTEPQFGVELPTALKREAQRSVLRGDSDYASRPAKLRAADRLLKTGLSGLPDTVKLRARKKVAAGVTAWKPAKRRP